MKNIVIYGGGFDPIHNGHLNMALNASKELDAEVFFVPAHVSVWKERSEVTDEDKVKIISKLLPNQDSVYPALSSYCAGNTRVLTKLLVRAIRIAELNNMEVNEDVVQASISQIIM